VYFHWRAPRVIRVRRPPKSCTSDVVTDSGSTIVATLSSGS
jgi:hypothetical protein